MTTRRCFERLPLIQSTFCCPEKINWFECNLHELFVKYGCHILLIAALTREYGGTALA